MILAGVKYNQIPEKHYKSCEGCVFENPDQTVKCNLKQLTVINRLDLNIECDNKIWINSEDN